jgi:hypothetical protein
LGEEEEAWVFSEEESAATGSISMEVNNQPEHLYRNVGVRGIQDGQETGWR